MDQASQSQPYSTTLSSPEEVTNPSAVQDSSSSTSQTDKTLQQIIDEVFEETEFPGTVEQHGSLFRIKLEKGFFWTGSAGMEQLQRGLEEAFRKEFGDGPNQQP